MEGWKEEEVAEFDIITSEEEGGREKEVGEGEKPPPPLPSKNLEATSVCLFFSFCLLSSLFLATLFTEAFPRGLTEGAV